jgi:hypothetical protein
LKELMTVLLMERPKVHLMGENLVMRRARRKDEYLGLNLAQHLEHWMAVKKGND